MRALVLSGGGSKGAWQAGAVAALCEKNHYDYVVGTSVGSVNALGLAYLGASHLPDLWRQIPSTSAVMALNIDWPWKLDGIWNFSPLRKYLIDRLDPSGVPSLEAYSAALNLHTGLVEYSRMAGDIAMVVDKVCGSCAVGGIQSPVNGLVDGGHKEIAPVRYAIETLKADVVDVVLCDPISEAPTEWTPWKYFPILSIAIRALGAMISEIGRTDVSEYRDDITLYQPSQGIPFDALSYNPNEIRQMVDMGYSDVAGKLKL